ncbi:aspartate aminotransferase family protein [Chitinophaga filiformis]|uniref:pyridoxal phosphate-dependent decarboxylase family protein n=1 Tax=Chitinophaga filiformis TaxID=104663 RepID=UPI001F2ECC1D|nr:aspartate aminotransferase family protein [Chitinophaga filiformis]MCF6402811.1 aspartate aminotransferase family protein [Chitinophaga filiformis]MCF6403271.1 aspartate aminotransferase family protein [Chitinophaga filiformis]
MIKNQYSDLFYEGTANEYSKAIQLASGSVVRFLEKNRKPFSGITPAQLKTAFEQVDLNTPLSDYESLLSEVERLYSDHAVTFHLPQYIAHLNCPVVIPAIAAEVLISAINSSLDTWDQSAGGTLIEQRLIEWTCSEIGFDNNSDGVFTSGGTQSNLMGLLLARDHYAKERLRYNIKQKGLPAESSRFRIFVAATGHFSIQKNAALLGLGEQSVVSIPVEGYRMNVALLKEAIQQELEEGNIPIAVVGTAGTTDFGNVDPLEEIGQLAARYKLWFHVDAAYGCGLLLTSRYRHLLKGIELANSVTADYHKSFFQPVSSSAFLVKNKRSLDLLTHHADYLNPKEHDEDGLPNQVNKSIQTTRRFDALKLWFTLRLMGKQKLGSYMETIIDTTAKVADMISQDAELELVSYSDISALVFRYFPASLDEADVTEVNLHIKKEMLKDGAALLAGTRINGAFYLKFTLLNPLTTTEDVAKLLSIIKSHGAAYMRQHRETLYDRREIA